MDNILNILLLEDTDSDAELLIRFLKKENIAFNYIRVWEKDTFIKALIENDFDLIIADHSLPQFSGMEAFHIAKNKNYNIPFILVTGTVTEKILIEYAKEGIDDYILKDNLLRLPSAIEHVISKKKIELLSKKLEVALKDITDSIHYAKTIQNSMLPDSILLYNSFPESFIIFKPKNILSGDFYWFKNDENTFYTAAADCTGHGIPGALMSMIGIDKLNNIVLTIKNTSEILEQLNKSIQIDLCQSTVYEHSQDGMDIALCAINKDTKTMHFSGANRPLWIIHKGQQEIEEIRGTKRGIGGISPETFVDFTNNTIQLYQGDTFYIFSDGFADQFGGKSDKKITTKRFKELLIEIHETPMKQQKLTIIKFIENWRNKTEQIDDVLIIGIRIL